MERPIDAAQRCRNYAEELRIIAAHKTTPSNRASLLRIAEDYDQMANSYEAIDKYKRAKGLPRQGSLGGDSDLRWKMKRSGLNDTDSVPKRCVQSDTMTDPETRRALLIVAKDYLDMAANMDRIANTYRALGR